MVVFKCAADATDAACTVLQYRQRVARVTYGRECLSLAVSVTRVVQLANWTRGVQKLVDAATTLRQLGAIQSRVFGHVEARESAALVWLRVLVLSQYTGVKRAAHIETSVQAVDEFH